MQRHCNPISSHWFFIALAKLMKLSSRLLQWPRVCIIYWKYSGQELFDQNDGAETIDLANIHDQSKELVWAVFQKACVTKLSNCIYWYCYFILLCRAVEKVGQGGGSADTHPSPPPPAYFQGHISFFRVKSENVKFYMQVTCESLVYLLNKT